MKTNKYICLIAASALVLSVAVSYAQQVPRKINYQGQLLDAAGNPADGDFPMDFAIFDAATGGTSLYTETRNVTVSNGLFDILIGNVTAIPYDVFDAVPRYLEVTIDGTALTPRHRFGSVPYAFNSHSALNSVNAGVGLAGGGTSGVVTLEIADDGVTSQKILNDTITADDLSTNSVYSDKIATDAVGSSEIATDAVGTSEIADYAVTGSKIYEGAVGSSELADEIKVGKGSEANGRLQLFSSSSSNQAVKLATTTAGGGHVRAYDGNGLYGCTLTQSVIGSGYVDIAEADVTLSNLAGFYNRGFIDTGGSGIYVDGNGRGVVYAEFKNFRMSHPYDEDKEIWYTAIEGPEASAYLRGTGHLANGRASVTFPEHFQIVANGETMTVYLTALYVGSKGLAVTAKNGAGFRVQELNQGTGNYDFDWEVKCVRKGYEDYRVVRNKSETMSARPVKETKAKVKPVR